MLCYLISSGYIVGRINKYLNITILHYACCTVIINKVCS